MWVKRGWFYETRSVSDVRASTHLGAEREISNGGLTSQVWTRGGWLTIFFFGLIGAAVRTVLSFNLLPPEHCVFDCPGPVPPFECR
jgi:hypothetical protein